MAGQRLTDRDRPTRDRHTMMQSSPLSFRRAVIWIGRLVLGPIFIYAGYSKAFLPNTNLWPFFVLKFSISVTLANFALQVDAFQLLSPGGVHLAGKVGEVHGN